MNSDGEPVAEGLQRLGQVALSHQRVADPFNGHGEIALAPAVAGLLLVMLVNLVAAHARQWAKPLWMSATIFALALIATHLIAPPLQSALMSAIGAAAGKLGMTPLFDMPQ